MRPDRASSAVACWTPPQPNCNSAGAAPDAGRRAAELRSTVPGRRDGRRRPAHRGIMYPGGAGNDPQGRWGAAAWRAAVSAAAAGRPRPDSGAAAPVVRRARCAGVSSVPTVLHCRVGCHCWLVQQCWRHGWASQPWHPSLQVGRGARARRAHGTPLLGAALPVAWRFTAIAATSGCRSPLTVLSFG